MNLASDKQNRHHPPAATISSHPDRRPTLTQIVALQLRVQVLQRVVLLPAPPLVTGFAAVA